MKNFIECKLFCLMFLFSMLLASNASVAGIVIISHPDNNVTLSKKEVQRIFLGKLKTFPGKGPVIPIDLSKDSSHRIEFSKDILRKNMRQVAAYWTRLIFTGKGLPPKQVDSIEELKKLVARNPDAIGYIDKGSLDDTVRVAYEDK